VCGHTACNEARDSNSRDGGQLPSPKRCEIGCLPDHRHFVDVLVGANLAMGLVPKRVCRGSKSTPSAYLTLFGWGLTGPAWKRSDSPLDCFFVTLDNEQLSDLMRAQYVHDFIMDFDRDALTLGSLGGADPDDEAVCSSRNEEKAMEIMKEGHRMENGHHVIPHMKEFMPKEIA
jgi:hypothetical protein